MDRKFTFNFVAIYYILQICFNGSSGAACQGLSADVSCQCDDYGRCMKGTVEIDPWMQFALKTQRELQIDFHVDQMQIFGAHNAFNNRAYGPVYGANDTCQWPPPYDNVCMGLANQEFSIIDMYNMGVRSVEIDNWWCADAFRIAHLGLPLAIWCGDFNVLLDDVFADMSQWLEEPGNENEVLRVYFNEKYPQGHDAEMNDALAEYLGHDRMLSPADLRDTYGGVWPTLRRMREDGKRVVVSAASTKTHQGKYIHVKSCPNDHADQFTNYPQCGGKTNTNCRRYTGDSTHYVFAAVYDGPSAVGVVTDLSEMVKCRINCPSNDMVNPQLMKTAVYTWAYGEPSIELDENTCVMLNYEDFRWYTSTSCSQSLRYACQSLTEPDVWTVSESTGPYDVTKDLCPTGYRFSVPHNGYRQQKLREAMSGKSVWLNYTPWITGVFPPIEGIHTTPLVSSSNIASGIARACVLVTIVAVKIIL